MYYFGIILMAFEQSSTSNFTWLFLFYIVSQQFDLVFMCVTLITINDAANDLTSFPICGFSCFVNNYIKHFNSMESFQKIYTRYTLVNHHLPFYNLPYVKCYVITVSVSRFSYQLAGSVCGKLACV